jgi:protein-L-isoaspartate(D-aspartate) O-methyltransferase
MIDFAAARRLMVDGQVRTADVTDLPLLAAMIELPRERFLPEDKVPLAYHDLDVPVGETETQIRRLLRPRVLAKLIQTAAITRADRVLDVGCATGYSTAVLAHLAGSVVGLEQDAGLARHAAATIADFGFINTKVVKGPLALGHPADAPYDVIIVEGSGEIVPAALFDQLGEGGRLVCVLGHEPGKAMLYQRVENVVSGRPVFDAAAAPLPGFAKAPEFVF